MKKKYLSAFTIASVILTSCISSSMSVSACQLSSEELTDKYGYLCEIYQDPDTAMYLATEKNGDAAYMPNTGTVTSSGIENGFCYDVIENTSIRITGADYSTLSPDTALLKIPDTIQGLPVKEIGYRAFCRAGEHLPALKEIEVPQSVEIIAERAFSRAFCDPIDVLMKMSVDEKKESGYRINIPENVRFIGYRAYFASAFAVANTSEDDRIIHLPESLEYLSAQAFDSEINSRAYGKIELDMPESLVFMSDACFESGLNWNYSTRPVIIHPYKYEDVFSEDIPEDYSPLMHSVLGKGFYRAERNIVTMKDILRSYLTENAIGITEISTRVYSYEHYASNDTACMGYNSKMNYWLNLAEKYAPDLLPTAYFSNNDSIHNAQITGTTTITGDVNGDSVVDISDAVTLARFCAEDNSIAVESSYFLNADANDDSRITLDDVNEILKIIAKI